MTAAVTDKLRRGAPAFSTTLAADKGAGAASATLSSATSVPTDTGIDFTVGRIDANGNKTPALKAVYKAVLSGSTISSLTLVEGTDQLHKAGTPVEITFTAATWNDMVTWGLTQHNQDGTHGTVTATSVTTTGAVTAGGIFTPSGGIASNTVKSTALALSHALDTANGVQSYTNTGSGGGTGFYINLGGLKLCWGISSSFSATSGSNYTASLPASFFTTIQYVDIKPYAPSVSGPSYAFNAFTTSTLTIFIGTTMTTFLEWFVIGV